MDIEKIYKSLTAKILGAILIAISGWLMATPLRKAMDIFFLDETGYLVRGLNMFPKIPKLWGPVYCFWYKILSFIESTPVDLFYLNFGLISVLLGLVTYICLVRFRIIWPVALFLSMTLMLAPGNLTTFPKVSHFAVIMAWVGLAVIYFVRDNLSRYALIACLFLVMSYVRPEFYLPFLIIFIGTLALIVFRRVQVTNLKLIGGLLVGVIVLHIGLGIPLGVELRGYKRSFIAFGEHFSWNYSKWNDIPGYLWLTWESILAEVFGDSRSLSDALLANPAAMMQHWVYNLGIYTDRLSEWVTQLIIPGKEVGVIWRLALILVLGSSLADKGIRTRLFSRIRHHKALVVFLILLAFPAAMSSVLIYPREHYLIIQLPVFIWLLGEWLTALWMRLDQTKLRFVLPLALLAFLVLQFGDARRPSDYSYFEMRKEDGKLNNLNYLAFLEEHADAMAGKTVLSHEGDVRAFVKTDFEFINALDKTDQPFDEFLEEVNPDLIYFTQTIFENPNYLNDPTWVDFVEDMNEERQGWHYIGVDGSGYDFILVNDSLSAALEAGK